MKRSRYLLACITGLLLTGNAAANVIDWNASLDTDQEVPEPEEVTGTEQGSASGTLDLDSGALSWDIEWSGLTDPVVGIHFHEGPPSEIGGIIVDIFSFDATVGEVLPAEASVTGSTAEPGFENLTPAQIDELLAGGWYVNVHTTTNPPGEIRGQVEPVPAPGSIALLGLGLLGMLLHRSRVG